MVCVRKFSGAEELLLAEAFDGNTGLALTLANRLARDVEGAHLDWSGGAVTDLDAFIVFLRRMLIGDRIRTDVACIAKDCGRRIDIDFDLGQFLDHHKPSLPRRSHRGWSVQPGHETGWYRLTPPGKDGAPSAATIDFRLPTPTDLLAVNGLPDADSELARRCFQPPTAPASLRRRAEAAMEAMAPCLSCLLEAICPECGMGMTLYFEPRQFCLRELRDRAASIYADVDVLARTYHWSESRILSLPRARRVAYVELARQAKSN